MNDDKLKQLAIDTVEQLNTIAGTERNNAIRVVHGALTQAYKDGYSEHEKDYPRFTQWLAQQGGEPWTVEAGARTRNG